MEKMSMIYDALLQLHAEKVLDEALRQFQLKRIYEEIDVALQEGDEDTFLNLTNELKKLNIQ